MVDDFDIKDGDIRTELVGGIPSITFSDRLLDRKITFNALLNRVTLLWKTNSPFQLMDLENDYFLVRFSEEDGYNNVLTNGSWVIFGQYLTVRPWSSDFSMNQDEVRVQVVWVRLPGLSENYYSSCILKAIGKAIGSMVRINENIVSATRGRFARLAICVDLRKPLISKVRINGHL
uniref:DUF4283 domain-containing protein n=1 Tax=Gossypium raimondii TaxID=29730 RepID=A0A0D2NK13_GOSRA|nr:hypothetical protein B456_002G087100 [Gossypium raimondii]